MDLRLPSLASTSYVSRSQQARVRGEAWAARELYCLVCDGDRLAPYRANTAVYDFQCDECEANYQLKTKSAAFGPSVANSGYRKKMDAIRAGRAPNYLFVHYDAREAIVRGAFAVPGSFFSADLIQRRAPLGPAAQRAGWIGSTILLGRLGTLARVALVQDAVERPRQEARAHWRRLRTLDRAPQSARPWLHDVWLVVQSLGHEEFTLAQIYAAAPALARAHPANRNVHAKIRQQLQFLRDGGFLEFARPGHYRVRPGPWRPRSMDLKIAASSFVSW